MQIYDGRESFYQWDTNQKITSTDFIVGEEIHFSNVRTPIALTVKAYELDGKVVADVPNILLQTTYSIRAYHYIRGKNSTQTVDEQTFLVNQRQQPSDYFYTETELYALRTDVAETLEEAKDAVSQLQEGLDNAEEALALATEVNASESERAVAENARVENENERITAENERQVNERVRIENEAERVEAEVTRANAEQTRQTAEEQRISNEDIREQNEELRIESESDREGNEATREQNEAERIKNETARQTAENQRVTAETARSTAETSRTTNETKRVTAEQNRVDAEAQRVEAENLRQANFEALPNNIGNAAKATVSGEIIRVDDVSPIEHIVNAKVGRVKNLIPYPYIERSKTNAGVTFTVNDDGSIILNGTAEGNTAFTLLSNGNIPVKGIYTLSGLIDGSNITYYMQPYVNGVAQKIVTEGSMSYQWEGTVTRIVIFVQTGSTFNNLVVTPQLELGDTATEYEPYIDPTTVTVTRCGKNLLGFNQSFTENWDDITIDYDNETQIFTLNGTYTHTAGGEKTILLHQYLADRPKISTDTMTTLTIERVGGNISTENAYNVVYLSCADRPTGARSNWYAVVLPTSKNNRSKAATHDYLNSLWFYISRDVTFTDYKIRIQLETGDVSTDYEKYNCATQIPSVEGTVEVTSVSPTMTLLTDTVGATIECEYNQDTSKVLEYVHADFRELDRVVAEFILNGGATDEQIAHGVHDYLEENPVKPGATAEEVAQIKQNKNDIESLENEMGDIGNILTYIIAVQENFISGGDTT